MMSTPLYSSKHNSEENPLLQNQQKINNTDSKDLSYLFGSYEQTESIPPNTPIPLPLPVHLPVDLESPFGWKKEAFTTHKAIKFFYRDQNPTISFHERRYKKYLGYLPIVGTIVGLRRIILGAQEYQHFQKTHLHSLSKRSVKWILRGAIELFPVVGGVACLLIDLFAQFLSRNDPKVKPLEDETDCGYCHQCDPKHC